MRHEAKIVDGSIVHTDAHGVGFTMRCCGSEKHEASGHIQDAAFLTLAELELKITRALEAHAELHMKKTRAAVHVMRLGKKGLSGCCEHPADTQGHDIEEEAGNNAKQTESTDGTASDHEV